MGADDLRLESHPQQLDALEGLDAQIGMAAAEFHHRRRRREVGGEKGRRQPHRSGGIGDIVEPQPGRNPNVTGKAAGDGQNHPALGGRWQRGVGVSPQFVIKLGQQRDRPGKARQRRFRENPPGRERLVAAQSGAAG